VQDAERTEVARPPLCHVLAPPGRCSDASRERGESPIATAPPAARLLLVEVPGAWGRSGLTGTRLTPGVSVPLAAAAEAAGVRVQLVRRPGRHPGPLRPGTLSATGHYAWALADPAAGVVRWGAWTEETELSGIDLAERLAPAVHAGTGPQRLALVCTHARHDVCCAVRGRPVAAALASAGRDRQVWETSHLGGDRFAANLLLLPEGELFGGLDELSAVQAAQAVDDGRLPLPHYRGRIGVSPVVQAGWHLAAAELGDDRRGGVRVLAVTAAGPGGEPGERWFDARVQHGDTVYRMRLIEWWAPPERLTCAAVEAKQARRYTLESMDQEVG
jgi:hypothetical protein